MFVCTTKIEMFKSKIENAKIEYSQIRGFFREESAEQPRPPFACQREVPKSNMLKSKIIKIQGFWSEESAEHPTLPLPGIFAIALTFNFIDSISKMIIEIVSGFWEN